MLNYTIFKFGSKIAEICTFLNKNYKILHFFRVKIEKCTSYFHFQNRSEIAAKCHCTAGSPFSRRKGADERLFARLTMLSDARHGDALFPFNFNNFLAILKNLNHWTNFVKNFFG